MTASRTENNPIAAWMQVLDQIEVVVGRRLTHVDELAQSSETGADPSAATPLRVLDDRLAEMQARLEQADQDARDGDDVLRREAEAYQAWTERMAAARRGLTDWAARLEQRDKGAAGRSPDAAGAQAAR